MVSTPRTYLPPTTLGLTRQFLKQRIRLARKVLGGFYAQREEDLQKMSTANRPVTIFDHNKEEREYHEYVLLAFETAWLAIDQALNDGASLPLASYVARDGGESLGHIEVVDFKDKAVRDLALRRAAIAEYGERPNGFQFERVTDRRSVERSGSRIVKP